MERLYSTSLSWRMSTVPQNLQITTIKAFTAEIKKTQQLLRLHDTPHPPGLPAISCWVGETWHNGGGDKLENCFEGKPTDFFFFFSGRFYRESCTKGLKCFLLLFFLSDNTNSLTATEVPLRRNAGPELWGIHCSHAMLKDSLRLETYLLTFINRCSLHLKIWWNCGHGLSQWALFLPGSCFCAEPKSD